MASKTQTMRSGGTQHPEEIMNFLTSRIVKDEGGIFEKSSDGFLCEEQAVPDMSVLINEGYAFLRKLNTDMVYPVRLYDGDGSVNISSNSSGNDRIDAIVVYVDLGQAVDPDINDVVKFMAVAGTPAGSPTAPTDGDIETAIGASNPYHRLADIDVADGAVSILDDDIADQREEVSWKIFDNFSGLQNYTAVTPTVTGTTDGVDTISFAGVDVTDKFSPGRYVIVSSTAGSNLVYQVKSATFSTNTTVELVGETSVSGTITAISYSSSRAPEGVTPFEMIFTARAYLSSNQENLVNNTYTKVLLDTESFDPNGDFATYKYTFPVSGYYKTKGQNAFTSVADQKLMTTNIYKNGASALANFINTSGINSVTALAGGKQYFNRGDYVELYARSSNGDNVVDIIGSSGLTFLEVEFLHV